MRGGRYWPSQEIQLAVRKDAASSTVAAVNGLSVEYNMCGNANSCSVPKGVSPSAPVVLTRREAYQLALLTFKYVPTVDNVVVLMPPLVKATSARDLHPPQRRGSILRAKTMDLPGAQTKINLERQAEMIAKRTDPFIYSWILANVDNTPTLVVNPISLDVKDSIPSVARSAASRLRRGGPASRTGSGRSSRGTTTACARAGAASARRGRARA